MSREGIEALKKEGPVQREDTQRITGAKANIATFKLQLLESKTTAEKAAAAAGLKEWSDYLAAEESRAAKSREYSDWYLKHAAARYALGHGMTDAAAEVIVRRHFESQGADGFVDAEGRLPFEGGRHFGPRVLAGLFLILLWWFIMTASQGEGMDMDFQRRRHPMWEWLLGHPVRPGAVWTWSEVNRAPMAWWWKLGAAAAGGVVLAGGAWRYLKILTYFPEPAASLSVAREYLRMHPHQHGWLAFTAVICAPLAEEYLFRGLLYRALDREWGGWRAVWASAGFFAICHPVASWLPVLALGAVNAMLFKRSGSLWPAVVLHMIYNLAVVFLT